MSLVKAIGGSNAAKTGGETDPNGGSVGMSGFTKMPYVGAKPAKMNSDIGTTEDSIGSMGNDGTNMSAYNEQAEDVSAENGK